MKKIILLILTLAFAQAALFAQTYPGIQIGDYRTTTPSYWDADSPTWETYNGTNTRNINDPVNWDSTTEIPGISPSGNITENVYIINDTYLIAPITLDASGRIWVRDNGSVTLNIGYFDDYAGLLNNYGDIDIQSGANAALNIFDNSSVEVFPGGSILDNSGGKITSNVETCIVIHSDELGLGLPNGSIITNSLVKGTYEQFIPGGEWHIISPPMDDVFASDFYDGNSVYIRPYLIPTVAWGPYIEVPATPIEAKKGYLVWEDVDYTFSKSGTFLTGNQTLPVVTETTYDVDGFNLIGNPYPSGINWPSVVAGNTNVQDYSYSIAYIYNPASGTYLTINEYGGSGELYGGTYPSNIIPPFQGFFFYAYDDNGVVISYDINLNNLMLAAPDKELTKSTNVDSHSNYMMLAADFKGQKSYTISYQEDGATNGKDRGDVPMLFSGSSSTMEVYTLSDDWQTCINTYSEYPYVMEVGFKVPAEGGDITITSSDLRDMDPLLSVSLQDIETGDYFDFLANPSYTFTAMGGDVTDRIYLIMNNNVGIQDIDKTGIQIFSNKNAVYLGYSDLQFSGELKIYNLLGQTVYQSKLTNNNYKPIYLNQPSAYYIVELITENESLTQKVFIQQ